MCNVNNTFYLLSSAYLYDPRIFVNVIDVFVPFHEIISSFYRLSKINDT